MDAHAQARLRGALEAEPRVLFAYLFGSQATGLTHARSDVDVAAWMTGAPSLPDDLDLRARLARAAGVPDVDLVALNAAPLTLAFESLKGKLLFSRDEGQRVAIEAGIMSRYHDRLPYMRRYLREAHARFKERGFA